MKNILFLPRFCYIFRTFVLPFYFFFTFHSAYLLGCRISFPALKSKRVSSLAGNIDRSYCFLSSLRSHDYCETVFGLFSSIFNRQRCRRFAGTLRVEVVSRSSESLAHKRTSKPLHSRACSPECHSMAGKDVF